MATLQALKKFLQCRGVYITPNGKDTTVAGTMYLTIPQSLAICAQEETQHEWSDKDIENALDKKIKFISEVLSDRIAGVPKVRLAT